VSDELFYSLIISNIISVLVLYFCAKRLLKYRRRQKRAFTFKSYPIPQCKLEDVHPCFTQSQLGPNPSSAVYFIGGEGVEASLTDRETWVVAALSKFSNRIFEFGTCSGKTSHIMAMNAPNGARVSTLTIHPSQLEQLSFDTNDDSVHKTIAKKEAKFDFFYYSDLPTSEKIEQIFSDSKKLDETKLKGVFDLILIDGAHTKSYVESDSKKAFSMLKKGGVILWHDYKPEAPDVFSYLNNLAQEVPLHHISDTDFVIYKDKQ